MIVQADSKDIERGDAQPFLSYQVTGFVNGENASILRGSPDLQTTVDETSHANHYPISLDRGSQAADNYFFEFVSSTLTVHPKVTDVRVSYGLKSASILGLNRTLPFVNINAIDVVFSDDVAVNDSPT